MGTIILQVEPHSDGVRSNEDIARRLRIIELVSLLDPHSYSNRETQFTVIL